MQNAVEMVCQGNSSSSENVDVLLINVIQSSSPSGIILRGCDHAATELDGGSSDQERRVVVTFRGGTYSFHPDLAATIGNDRFYPARQDGNTFINSVRFDQLKQRKHLMHPASVPLPSGQIFIARPGVCDVSIVDVDASEVPDSPQPALDLPLEREPRDVDL